MALPDAIRPTLPYVKVPVCDPGDTLFTSIAYVVETCQWLQEADPPVPSLHLMLEFLYLAHMDDTHKALHGIETLLEEGALNNLVALQHSLLQVQSSEGTAPS